MTTSSGACWSNTASVSANPRHGAWFTSYESKRVLGRLQEVDDFPGWRGHGYGDALLAAVLTLLVVDGCTSVVVGSDEDD